MLKISGIKSYYLKMGKGFMRKLVVYHSGKNAFSVFLVTDQLNIQIHVL